jgi:hypothetical protein
MLKKNTSPGNRGGSSDSPHAPARKREDEVSNGPRCPAPHLPQDPRIEDIAAHLIVCLNRKRSSLMVEVYLGSHGKHLGRIPSPIGHSEHPVANNRRDPFPSDKRQTVSSYGA